MKLEIQYESNVSNIEHLWKKTLPTDAFVSEKYLWTTQYLKCYPTLKPLIVIAKTGHVVDAIIPLTLKETFVSSICTSKTDRNFMYIKNSEVAAEIVQTLIKHFSEVRLYNIHEKHLNCFNNLKYEVIKSTPCPVIDLQKDKFLNTSIFRNVERGLINVSMGLQKHALVKANKQLLSRFLLLNRIWWNNRGFPGLAANSREEEFFENVFTNQENDVWLSLLYSESENEFASAILLILNKDIAYSYGSAHILPYKKYSIGTLNYFYLLNSLKLKGIKEVDLLRGNEQYKYRMGATDSYSIVDVKFC